MVRLAYVLAHPESRTVRRLVRKFNTYRSLVIALLSDRFNSRLLLNRHVLGHKWLVRMLLARGCDASVKDDCNSTPLHRAINGHADVVALLLAAGANVEAKDFKSETPLRWASMYKHAAVVKLLETAMN